MDPRVQRFQRQGDTKKNMQVRNHSSVSGHHHPVCFVRTCVWSHMRTEKAHQPRSHWETEEKKTKGGSNVPLRNILQAASMKVVRYNYCWCNPRNRLLWTIGTLATFLLVGAVVVKWLSLFKARKQRKFSHLLQIRSDGVEFQYIPSAVAKSLLFLHEKDHFPFFHSMFVFRSYCYKPM